LKIRLAKQQGKPVPTAILGPTVSGILKKPDGDGPFPAVIMLPTSGGWKHTPKYWQGLLNDWGYVTLEVHSFEARGYTRLPSYQPRKVIAPAGGMLLDAIGANEHLRTLPFVDGSRIAIMGWSFGAMTALAAVDKLTGSVNYQDRFATAVAFYPGCEASGDFFAPALILIGALDNETRPRKCEAMLRDKPDGSAPIELKIYPDSYHKFDAPGVPKFIEGYLYKYNAAATSDAKLRVKAFLGKHL
jgi:dienelactone hydrolase